MESGAQRIGGERCQKKILYVDIDFENGRKFACPSCAQLCPVHDSEVKRWRHMNFWQHSTYLSARVPRIECPEHKVRQGEVPWAAAPTETCARISPPGLAVVCAFA